MCVCFAWFWGNGHGLVECGLLVKIIRRICDCLSMFLTMGGGMHGGTREGGDLWLFIGGVFLVACDLGL